jgi:hypothetical protein
VAIVVSQFSGLTPGEVRLTGERPTAAERLHRDGLRDARAHAVSGFRNAMQLARVIVAANCNEPCHVETSVYARLYARSSPNLGLSTAGSEVVTVAGPPSRSLALSRRREGRANTVSRRTGPAVGAGEFVPRRSTRRCLITRLLQSTGQRCTFGAELIETTCGRRPAGGGWNLLSRMVADRSPGRHDRD